mgnify:CR=1 FL=1
MKKQTNTNKKVVKNTKVKKVNYTIDDLKDVWYRAVYNGALLWQYSKDEKLNFEDGVQGIREILDTEGLRTILGNNFVLLGLFNEKQKPKKSSKKD